MIRRFGKKKNKIIKFTDDSQTSIACSYCKFFMGCDIRKMAVRMKYDDVDVIYKAVSCSKNIEVWNS